MSSTREARSLLAAGKVREAARMFEIQGHLRQAVQAFVQAGDWAGAGRVSEAAGKHERALEYYRKARSPADMGRLLELLGMYETAGQAFADAEDFASAARVFELELARLNRRNTDTSSRRKAARWAAHFHAKAGDPDRACKLLSDSGEPERAARVLASAGHHAKAAKLYLDLGMRQQAVDILVRAEKPAEAAKLCEDAGEFLLAARLYFNAGNMERSAHCYVSAHEWREAAQVAVLVPDWGLAGQMFSRAGEPLESGRAFLRAERPDEAIKSLAQIRFDDPRYQQAVAVVVQALELKGDMSFAAERFLNEFVYRPLDDDGAALLYRLAQVYEKGEFWETAQEHYEKLLKKRPDDDDAAEGLKRVIAYQRDSAAIYKQVLKEDFDYEDRTKRMQRRRKAQLEPTGDLESFPDLPPSPGGEDPTTRAEPEQEVPAPRHPAPAATGPGPGTPHRPGDSSVTRTWAHQATIVRLEPGARLGTRYQLQAKIGAGGRGAVFLAQDLELNEPIAIKVLHPTDVTEQSLDQFRQELKLARKLTHPNIIRLYDIGEVEGLRFITMEYLDGRDLESLLEGAPNGLEFSQGVDLALQVCDGLGAAHELGVIHRDIKPSNVVVQADGRAKILDFGIAKLMDAQGMTRTGLAYGTPLYMSPEQIQGQRDLDHRTDLYSLGCLMFVLFTGRLPFEAEEAFQLLMAHVSRPPPSPSEFRPDIPPRLEQILLTLLEKNREDRFASCADLRRAIEGAL